MTGLKRTVRAVLSMAPFLTPVATALRDRFRTRSVSGSFNVADSYRVLEPEEFEASAARLLDSWKDERIPARQRELVERQLHDYRNGGSNPVFDAIVDTLRTNVHDLDSKTLLEVGCASGYYCEVFTLRGITSQYTGCDYSRPLVSLAQKLYANVRFDVEDATSLSYGSEQFDIVISGGCILHIPDYERAISETARVSRQYVAFHRTPVLYQSGPIVYTKKAYGVDTVETHFNEQELVRLFYRNGLRVIDANTHEISWIAQYSDALAMKTYLCEKT